MIMLIALVSLVALVLLRRRKARQRRDAAPVVVYSDHASEAHGRSIPGFFRGSGGSM